MGQSTYGDLSLHLAVTTSIVNAKFPLENSLMLGATMAYPYLADSVASTMLMLGQPLPMAMAFTGTLMMALVYMGYGLLCAQLCRRRGAAFLAFFLLFLNGGLGFFYTLGAKVDGYEVTSLWDNLRNVMEGFYQTPTNQPDPYNLRWSNIVCDMLIPQRGILGGWTMLLPCLNLLLPPLCQREKHGGRELVLLGLFAGGLPLIHTHSFLALVLLSAGCCLYCVLTAPGEPALRRLSPGSCTEASPPRFRFRSCSHSPLFRLRAATIFCASSSTGATTGAIRDWWITTSGFTSRISACPIC